MNSILGKIDTKLDKQMKHDARIKQQDKARANESDALDQEKQRLLKIAALNPFSFAQGLD